MQLVCHSENEIEIRLSSIRLGRTARLVSFYTNLKHALETLFFR